MQALFVLVIGLFSVLAMAQDGANSASVEDVAEVKTLKKINVTGSYIKRVDEEAPNPVQTISTETVKKSGYNSVADVLRDNAITTGGQRESANSGSPGAATTGIGPFGSDSILVLLDGNRMPKIGGDNSVDLNLIPTAAIERIEVLKDGASATYGSDAIGGVINIITKKDYNGGTVNLGQSVTEAGGANRTDFNGTFGKTFKRGSITGVIQYRNNAELASADRPFTRVNNLELQGSGTSQVGQWTGTDGNNHFVPGSCPTNQLDSTGTYCLFDYSKYSWEMPKIAQYSTLLNGQYKFSENLKLKSQLNATYREVGTRMAPAPGKIKLTPQEAANNLGITNAETNPVDGMVELSYRILSGGTRDTQDNTLSVNTAQTLEGKIAGTWTWDLTGAYANSRTRNDGRGFADRRILRELITSKKWNPLLPIDQQGSIASAMFNPFSITQSQMAEARAVTSGQITDSSSLAIGTSAGWQMYSSEVDAVTASNNNFGGNGGNGYGTRNSQAVFTEASIFPIESIEVGAAARYDKYSDFGQTFNPKLSLSWQASNKLMFRTSIGTGFRAPNLSDLYNGGSLGYPSAFDQKGCDAGVTTACSNRQYEVSTKANPNLTQEKSLFWNTGFVLQPKKNWSIESNLFVAKIDNAVGGLDLTQVMRASQIFGEDYLRQNYQIDIVRKQNGTGEIDHVNMLSAYNIATKNRQGIDFHITNQSKVNLGRFPVEVITDLTHIQFLKISQENFPGLGLQNSQDNYFKDTLSVTGIHSRHSLKAAVRTLSGGDKSRNYATLGRVGYGSLRTHTEFDMNYTMQGFFKKMTLSMGVKNMFNAKRPLDNTAQVALDTSVYDPLGRYYYTSLGYTF